MTFPAGADGAAGPCLSTLYEHYGGRKQIKRDVRVMWATWWVTDTLRTPGEHLLHCDIYMVVLIYNIERKFPSSGLCTDVSLLRMCLFLERRALVNSISYYPLCPLVIYIYCITHMNVLGGYYGFFLSLRHSVCTRFIMLKNINILPVVSYGRERIAGKQDVVVSMVFKPIIKSRVNKKKHKII